MSAVNLDTGFYLVQDGVAFQWYERREDAERAITRYSTTGWRVVPAAELQRKG